jgi:hypothetical protein
MTRPNSALLDADSGTGNKIKVSGDISKSYRVLS